jgi:hypothetical protein
MNHDPLDGSPDRGAAGDRAATASLLKCHRGQVRRTVAMRFDARFRVRGHASDVIGEDGLDAVQRFETVLAALPGEIAEDRA